MKSIALIAVGVLLGVVMMFFVPHGAPQVVYAGSPSGNGDVNGDGRIDIADGIYIINYLLRDGPLPVAIECAACDSCCPEPPACDSCCPEPPPCDSCCAPAPPQDFLCQYADASVTLTWSSAVSYADFQLTRNGAPLAELPGTEASYLDNDVVPGMTYTYSLSGSVGGKWSASVSCTVTLCVACPPCNSCCPSHLSSTLPATGALQCWNANPFPSDCDDPAFPGEDASYQAGCSAEGRFVDNGDGTITDNCTGLMWQKESAPNPGSWLWQGALKYCADLELAGYDDWRLPNIRELLSLVNYGRLNPCNDPVFQSWGQWYWSSSTYVAQTDAWCVHFFKGETKSRNKYTSGDIRAVRGGL